MVMSMEFRACLMRAVFVYFVPLSGTEDRPSAGVGCGVNLSRVRTLISLGCRYLPYRVLIPAVSDADTCPSRARSQLGTRRHPQCWDSAFCRLRVGRQALWVSAPQPILRAIFLSDSPYLLMLLNISQLIPVPQRVVVNRGRRCVLRHFC